MVSIGKKIFFPIYLSRNYDEAHRSFSYSFSWWDLLIVAVAQRANPEFLERKQLKHG